MIQTGKKESNRSLKFKATLSDYRYGESTADYPQKPKHCPLTRAVVG